MQTAFSSQPASSASTCCWLVFFNVICITVTGNAESSGLRGMNGENASSETATGEAGSRYSMNAIGYSPQKLTSFQPLASSVRTCDLPSLVIFNANPCSTGDLASRGLA